MPQSFVHLYMELIFKILNAVEGAAIYIERYTRAVHGADKLN